MATVGVIANPHAGKDVRRLVGHAGVVSDAQKIALLRRAVSGAVEGGATRVLLAPDRNALARRAIEPLTLDAEVRVLEGRALGSAADTTDAVRHLRDAGEVGAVIVLGGDGTCRDAAKGWPGLPMVALSTGTNNVFPTPVEPTVAGLAAGLVASGAVDLDDAGRRTDLIHLAFDDGRPDDVALVDLALLRGSLTGAGAVWSADQLLELVAAVAEPGTVGLSALAAMIRPCSRTEPGGVHVVFGGDCRVRAPIAPGLWAEVGYARVDALAEGEAVVLAGPGVLALDGERQHVLDASTNVRVEIRRDGPQLIDVPATIRLAVEAHQFIRPGIAERR